MDLKPNTTRDLLENLKTVDGGLHADAVCVLAALELCGANTRLIASVGKDYLVKLASSTEDAKAAAVASEVLRLETYLLLQTSRAQTTLQDRIDSFVFDRCPVVVAKSTAVPAGAKRPAPESSAGHKEAPARKKSTSPTGSVARPKPTTTTGRTNPSLQ